jgi:cytochrome P450 family 110
MSARDEDGEAMTDVELRDELMTILLAGHETTATALTWTLYWIHKYPLVLEQLLKELKDPVDANALTRLPYLNAICCESLRIFPVGMLTFPRAVRSTVELMGHSLEPGTVVVGSIYLAHHRKAV